MIFERLTPAARSPTNTHFPSDSAPWTETQTHHDAQAIQVLFDGYAWPHADTSTPFDSLQETQAWIQQAYLRWGIDFVSHLSGGFGLVIQDPGLQKIFLIRDHLGIRPLYWTQTADDLWVSTQLEPLVKATGASLCESTIARYLHEPWAPIKDSFFQNIHSVRPGQCVTVSPQRVSKHLWWDPREIKEQAISDAGEVVEALRHHTQAAIARCLPAHASVGAHLSGGVDSGLITELATQTLKAQGRRLQACYCWSPPIDSQDPPLGQGDERVRLQALTDRFGIPLRFGRETTKSIAALIDQPMEFQGVADVVDELGTLEQAATDGIDLILSGWGGDECFSNHGHGVLSELMGQGSFKTLLSRAYQHSTGGRTRGFFQVLWHQGLMPRLPDRLYQRIRFQDTLYPDTAFPSKLLVSRYQYLAPSRALRLRADAKDFLCQLLMYGHLEERMKTWLAWSSPYGLEHRYPLLDRCLIEFILSLPIHWLFGEGEPRHLVRRAFKDQPSADASKRDRACEAMRARQRVSWWQTLQRHERLGHFDGDCPWLDIKKIRRVLKETPLPSQSTRKHPGHKQERRWIGQVARMRVAMRVWAMYQRSIGNRVEMGQ